MNLTKKTFHKDDFSLLQKNLNFIPDPGPYNKKIFNEDLEKYFRRIILKAHFQDSPEYKYEGYTNITNSSWIPKEFHHSIKTYMQTVKNDLDNPSGNDQQKRKPNITPGEKEALARLRDRDDIIISKADKGGAVVIQNTDDYIKEANRQLQDREFYLPQDRDLTPAHTKQINDTIDQFSRERLIPEKTAKALKVHSAKTARFYTLPKIHKPGNPGRPIISAIGNATSKLAEFVDFHLQPIAEALPSYVKDTGAFLRKINAIQPAPPKGAILVTMDVASLYTNIPHRDGMNAAAQALQRRRSPSIPTRVILKFLSLVLHRNNFLFNDQHFLQIKGCAMGSKCSGSYADTFMGKFEGDHIYPRIEGKHLCYTRFKDDVFLIWTDGKESLLKFFEEINQVHPSIKFDCKYAYDKINFLDVLIHLNRYGLSTTLYKKPTDRNAYLHYGSYHPENQKKNIPYGQFLRARKICSNKKDAEKAIDEIAQKLTNRGYPKQAINQHREKAISTPREALLADKPKSSARRTPFTTTFNRNLPPIQRTINKHWHLLHTDPTTATAFEEPPVLAYRKNKNLRNLIGQVHISRGTKILPKKSPKLKGCVPCLSSNRNKCCRQLTSTKTFKSDRTQEEFEILHLLNCKSEYCLYLGYCLKCPNHQYVGKSEPVAHHRFNTHRYDVNRPSGLNFDHHFALPGHSFDHDARFILIEQMKNHHHLTKEENRRIMEKREDYWIQKLKTLAPLGLNDKLNSATTAQIQAICQ